MPEDRPAGWLRRLTMVPNDRPLKAILVVLVVCLFASVLVTTTSVLLRPMREANEQRARMAKLTGVLSGAQQALGERAKAVVVDLESGLPDETLNPETYDLRAATSDPATSVEISPDRDIAGLGRRARHSVVHLLYSNGDLDLIVLPVHGKGYASTLYGYLGLTGDTEEVVGLTFFEHAETPGLGAMIENPTWLERWQGKRVWRAPGEPALGVAEGPLDRTAPESVYLVDGLTGATWTGRGVTNLLRFWLGPDGYGPFLKNVRERKVG